MIRKRNSSKDKIFDVVKTVSEISESMNHLWSKLGWVEKVLEEFRESVSISKNISMELPGKMEYRNGEFTFDDKFSTRKKWLMEHIGGPSSGWTTTVVDMLLSCGYSGPDDTNSTWRGRLRALARLLHLHEHLDELTRVLNEVKESLKDGNKKLDDKLPPLKGSIGVLSTVNREE